MLHGRGQDWVYGGVCLGWVEHPNQKQWSVHHYEIEIKNLYNYQDPKVHGMWISTVFAFALLIWAMALPMCASIL